MTTQFKKNATIFKLKPPIKYSILLYWSSLQLDSKTTLIERPAFKIARNWYGYIVQVWLYSTGMVIKNWYGYKELVWLYSTGMVIKNWYGYNVLVWL